MSEVRDQTKRQPSYSLLLETGEFTRRVAALEALLERCTVCPRDCLNNRLKDEIAACYSGRLPIVSSYTAHFASFLVTGDGKVLKVGRYRQVAVVTPRQFLEQFA